MFLIFVSALVKLFHKSSSDLSWGYQVFLIDKTLCNFQSFFFFVFFSHIFQNIGIDNCRQAMAYMYIVNLIQTFQWTCDETVIQLLLKLLWHRRLSIRKLDSNIRFSISELRHNIFSCTSEYLANIYLFKVNDRNTKKGVKYIQR